MASRLDVEMCLKKWGDTRLDALKEIESSFIIRDFKIDLTRKAIALSERYKYSYYDSLIIAAALDSKCSILYTEDMHHNQLIEKKLRIINPF